MSDLFEFIAPKMIGERFKNHTIPLEVLKDIAVLEEMIVEVAKWRYLQDNLERQRTPRGFTDGISLFLKSIERGSAIPKIWMDVTAQELVPQQNQHYFELARDNIVAAINAAANDEEHITEHLPANLLGFFDRIGRSLREGEGIEFSPTNPDRPACLNKATRRKLILASQVKELTEEVILRGTVPEADQAKGTFEIQIINGPSVVAPISSQHLETVKEAFNGYGKGTRILLQGIGRYSRNGRLLRIETVEHLSLLDINDVSARLEEFLSLKDGWLDGVEGIAPKKEFLSAFEALFQSGYPDNLLLPYLYPTAEGGLQAEWSISGVEITLDINSEEMEGEWHSVNMASGKENTKKLNLKKTESWKWIIQEIKQAFIL